MTPRLCQRLYSSSACPSLPRDAVEHLSEGALELLPVLLLVEDLVDRFEGLQLRVIEVEGLVEHLHGLVDVLDLVAVDDRDRVHVLRLRLITLIEVGDAPDDHDRVVPLARLLVEHQQLVEEPVVVGLELRRLGVGFDRLLRVLGLLVPQVTDGLKHPEALLDLSDLEDLLLVVDDLFPVVRLLVDPDHRLERRAVMRILFEGLVEHVERLAPLTLLAFDDTELGRRCR